MKNMKKLLLVAVLAFVAFAAKGQSTVMEVSWNVYGENYTGLMVIYPNLTGVFKVYYSVAGLGTCWCVQDARISNDASGNIYINCYNPRSNSPGGYSPDNFAISPDGSMVTMDAQGVWSAQIGAQVVPQNQWASKMRAYGL